jgi:hypothetical protein
VVSWKPEDQEELHLFSNESGICIVAARWQGAKNVPKASSERRQLKKWDGMCKRNYPLWLNPAFRITYGNIMILSASFAAGHFPGKHSWQTIVDFGTMHKTKRPGHLIFEQHQSIVMSNNAARPRKLQREQSSQP